MKNLSKTIISILVLFAIVFSLGTFYNNVEENYEDYIVIESKGNPENMQKRIVVLENCESGEKLTKEVLNRTTYAILYREGKIVEIRK